MPPTRCRDTENFLLTSKGPEGELKLTDFGLGVFFKPGERFRDLVGSPYYVAPEVLRKNYRCVRPASSRRGSSGHGSIHTRLHTSQHRVS